MQFPQILNKPLHTGEEAGSACSAVFEGAEAKGLSQRPCDIDTITSLAGLYMPRYE
ncbi:hypothetical protein FOXG_18107 [Fusarium oxysporum f. sp. lycopersici 4287]|uniref:Uncharacterized protein n=2 Tax=Fusarium oxysporum TaxID=5507 RepID=A0A0J9UA26_FUSO4|nr:hypothetical protein FOXG_18107 [Fusarium oxysporum f. sp. lycopersici 4287]EXK43023.1 hypothetical protein FOMG_05724 [Fusarium oxysporum f. sp. melonis 26406]KNA96128.1 hypothetical protein FOXG_18107 [Fusarium oxysporum f. sp. lycopersici 4287]